MNDITRYTFSNSRSGEIIPSLCTPSGAAPLHSAVDPVREAQRLLDSTLGEETGDFLIFLGLGGGFAPLLALDRGAAHIAVIDFNSDGVSQLLNSKDYSKLLQNERFSLLVDPSDDEIKSFILEKYRPALCGGIKTIPLRARVEHDSEKFRCAVRAIEEAIENVSADFSVQSHFGRRWFSNIIRNIRAFRPEQQERSLEIFASPIPDAAIIAAGPSLDTQIPQLAQCKSKNVFIICCDTALPVLLHHNIAPDAIVSIDCQHISYYHFMGCGNSEILKNIPLFLDIASPPMLSRLSPPALAEPIASPVFFSSGHPLALYISQHWKPLPRLDTSGGNVTYACLSLAETLGAKRITLFGADFSYLRSQSYARGTYIYPFFEKKQNRFSAMEALFSAFLYRSPFLPCENSEQGAKNRRETSSLRFYRKKFEEKAAAMDARITAASCGEIPCAGKECAEILVRAARPDVRKQSITGIEFFASSGAPEISGGKFLEQYRGGIAALPEAKSGESYTNCLSAKELQVFTTMLPLAAYLKRRDNSLKTRDLIEETKRYSVSLLE